MSVLPEVETALIEAVRRDHDRSAPWSRRIRQLVPGWGAVFAAVAAAGALAIAFLAVSLIHHRNAVAPATSLLSAPRGGIVDAHGTPLAVNRRRVIVTLRPAALPRTSTERHQIYEWVAHLLGIWRHPCASGDAQFEQLMHLACGEKFTGTLSPELLLGDSATSQRAATYLARHPRTFPGVSVTTKVSPAYTSSAKSVRIVLGIEGNAGLVEHYRSALRSGDTVQLSLDTTLQDAAVRSLRRAVASTPGATNGSFVAMNPRNGEVYAIGSLPPQVTNSGPIAPNTFADRATQIAGPIGSTFSPIAALAALQSGRWTASQTYDDTGRYVDGSGDVRQNAGGAAYGVIDTTRAIAVSSDDFFYNLGARLSSAQPSGGPLQEWARALGIGQRTGIDAGPENEGILPSPAWWAGRNNLERQCEQGTGPFAGKPRRSSCGIADGRPWSVDDDENLAVGQGDLEATPLQVAVAYSAIENDGNVVQPHVGRQIADPSGTAVHTISPPARRTLRLDPTDRAAVLTGLRDASSIPGGTAADVFGNFPEPVYGKTGTAQLAGRANQAWYAGFVPSSESKRPIVVVVSVDGGGFGAATAAPVARQIFSQWFFGKPGPYRRGRSHTL